MNSNTIAIINASLWNGEADTWTQKSTVILEDGRVREVGPSSVVTVEPGVQIIDASNKFVIPGLTDLHVHLTTNSNPCNVVENSTYRGLVSKPEKLLHGMRNSWKALSAGFTTLRVMGHREVGEVEYRSFVDKGLLPGPRMYVAPWWVSMTAGHGDLFYPKELERRQWDTADGPDECRKMVRLQVRAGADFIKVMASGGVLSHGDKPHWPNYTDLELTSIVEEAHDLDLKVAAHAHSAEGIKRAVRAGVQTIEHGSFMDDECLQLMLDAGTVLVPTLSIMDWLSNDGSARGVPKDQLSRLTSARASQFATVSRAYAAGVPIGMGTDSSGVLCPFGEHARELELYVECGMTPVDALRTATTNAARVLGREGEIGRLQMGSLADVVVLAEDPLADITVLRREGAISYVFKGGLDVTNLAQDIVTTVRSE